jgi:virginiamycin B lyase
MDNLKTLLRSLLFLIPIVCPRQAAAVTGVFTEARIPSAAAGASGIVAGNDGGWWFTEFSANKIGRFSTSGEIVEFPIPTPNSGPLGIAADWRTGAVWFTEFNANKIGRITPDGVVKEFSIPTPSSGPVGIVSVPGTLQVDGSLSSWVWFSESNANQIGRLMQDGSFSEVAIPTPGSIPMGVWGDGINVWFTEFQGNKIGRISVGAGTSLTEVAVPTANAGPLSLTGGDTFVGVWFTEANANKIGLLSEGAITEFSVPSANAGLSGIVTTLGLAWFTERSANKIGSVTRDGRFTEYMIPSPASEPLGITRFAFEGQIVFTERSGNAITRFQPDTAVVLAAQNVGGWTTEFDFANVEDQAVTLFGFPAALPQTACGICSPELRLSIPPRGSGKATASQITFGFGALFFRSLEDGILPSVKARLVNAASPSKTIDIPTIRLSTVAALDPAVLVFPSALRTRGGGHSNLLISEISARAYLRFPIPQDVQVLVEGFSAAGQSVGSLNATVPGYDSLYLVDVLGKLGVDELSGGSIRLTRVGGRGIMWGYLITVTDDGAIGVSLGATP